MMEMNIILCACCAGAWFESYHRIQHKTEIRILKKLNIEFIF